MAEMLIGAPCSHSVCYYKLGVDDYFRRNMDVMVAKVLGCVLVIGLQYMI